MDTLCVVVGCEVTVSPGFKTCSEPSHRELEDLSGHSALFQLRRRLERLKTKHIEDDGDGLTEELVDVDTQGENPVMDVEKEPDGCPSKSDEGNSRPRARFGRRRTHNEQLCVATCGVMLARATFYGSEAALSYDNACSFKKHVQAKGDSYFDGIAMPVDVFHMKTKHKETDAFCGQYCNPAMFPDLVVNGRWWFNTSAAEMTNAWIGGFGAIVREMRPDRYDFFLDEMIKHRNRMIVDDLRERDAYPFEIPRSLLLS
ncbi:hypothetical protein OF83DRAFT_1252236 [Amylostereum chailletii]|nr:hypothetical protein OF83DRAFT_1252236 [Amylostereum chailletii]